MHLPIKITRNRALGLGGVVKRSVSHFAEGTVARPCHSGADRRGVL